MKQLGTVAGNVVSNCGALALAYHGLFQGVGWATNLLVFIVWAIAALYTVVACQQKVKDELRAKGPSMPLWLSGCTDMLLMLAFASVGRYFSAAVMLWQICVTCNVYLGGEDFTK